MLNLSISKISGITWVVEACSRPEVSVTSGYATRERRPYRERQQEVGRRHFMVFLMVENGGFLGFDEVSRHSTSLALGFSRHGIAGLGRLDRLGGDVVEASPPPFKYVMQTWSE